MQIFSIKKENDHLIINIFGIKAKFKIKEDCAVFMEPGGIGDYLMCRQYFKYIKNSPKFENLKIIYIADEKYVKITQHYDANCFDKILKYTKSNKNSAVAVTKYLNERFNIRKLIDLACKFEGSSNLISRNILVEKIKSREKITTYINLKNKNNTINPLLKYYNKVITLDTPVFESEQKRIVFEKLLDIKLSEEEIYLSVPPLDFKKKLIAVCVKANEQTRCLSNEKQRSILKYLAENTDDNVQILVTGRGGKEKEIINDIIEPIKRPDKIINIAGETAISFLPILLSNCRFLISVETGTVHMAKCAGCKAICISSGMYYGRFQPHDGIRYIYPDSFKEYIKSASEDELNAIYNNNHTLFDINDIKIEDIMEAVDDYLKITDCASKEFNMSETRMVVGGGVE